MPITLLRVVWKFRDVNVRRVDVPRTTFLVLTALTGRSADLSVSSSYCPRPVTYDVRNNV
jgi:hypothetical protein